MFFIQKAFNWDIVFPEQDFVNKKFINYSPSFVTCKNITCDTKIKINNESLPYFKARLSGISTIRNKQNITGEDKKQIKAANYFLTQYGKTTRNVFLCEIISVDKFNRLIINIYDPVTKESIVDILLRNYSNVFRKYV